MAIVDLAVHPYAYVTIAELAGYWRLPQSSVMAYVRAGHFEAIKFGAGIYRVRTRTALEFERRSIVPATRLKQAVAGLAAAVPARPDADQDGEPEWEKLRCVPPRTADHPRSSQ
jgi:hypothetical protein